MKQELLRNYAEMAVKIGVNIQPGQTLVIRAPINGAELARECAEIAYQVGAKEVVVFYNDEKLSRIRMQYTDRETLCDIKEWEKIQMLNYIRQEGSAAFLTIVARDPEIYKGLDLEKIEAANTAASMALQEFRDYMMNSRVQWCVVAIPNEAWAKKVFPDLSVDAAVEKLWETIFKVSRLEGDPAANWQEYVDKQLRRRAILNEYSFEKIHMTSANGTDLYVGLADDHVWNGGQDNTSGGKPYTTVGVPFIANMPTEEIFTTPHKDRVDGIVYGTKPYAYNGNIIDGFWVKFKDGKAVEAGAKTGEELFKQLLSTDEGACRIGEVALVPASSPINRQNVLFYNTLFDENAACHIAFGAAYPDAVKGGTEMTREQLAEKGANYSIIHDDVMVGSEDMNIVGITKDGKEVQIFKDGEWVF